MNRILSLLSSSREQCLAQIVDNPEIRKCLAERECEIVDGPAKDYNNVFMTQDLLACKTLKKYNNIICFERVAGCRLSRRSAMSHPNLKAMVRLSMFENWEDNNIPCQYDRLFLSEIDPSMKENARTEIPLAMEHARKLVIGPSLWHFKMHDNLCNMLSGTKTRPLKDRKIDVFFAGTTHYVAPGDYGSKCAAILDIHRKHCLDAARALPFKNILIKESCDYTREEYCEILLDTKFALSPWGWGEVCHRDYEAVACGCALVRPAMPYPIVSNPRIDSYGVFVKPDFSDMNLHQIDLESVPVIDDERRADWIAMRSPERISKDIILKLVEGGK